MFSVLKQKRLEANFKSFVEREGMISIQNSIMLSVFILGKSNNNSNNNSILWCF